MRPHFMQQATCVISLSGSDRGCFCRGNYVQGGRGEGGYVHFPISGAALLQGTPAAASVCLSASANLPQLSNWTHPAIGKNEKRKFGWNCYFRPRPINAGTHSSRRSPLAVDGKRRRAPAVASYYDSSSQQ